MRYKVTSATAMRYLLRLILIKLRAHPYVEFSDTGTAAYFIEYGIDRIRVG